MEIRFEISPMYGPIDHEPRRALASVMEKACGHLKHLYESKVIVTNLEREDGSDDIYHVTLTGDYDNLFPVFEHLYHFFYWKNLEDPIMTGRFTRIIF